MTGLLSWTKTWRKKAGLAFAALAFFAMSFSFAEPASEDLKSMLAASPAIRVYVSPAPGFGHQAATTTVMKRLRQLGFQGRFEVVYDPWMAQKLATLLPGMNPAIPGWQEIPELGIRAISYQEFGKLPEISTLALGITGADDNPNFMRPERLHVEHYIRLQPLGWGSSYLFTLGDPNPRRLEGLDGLGYHYDIPDSEAAITSNIEEARRALDMAPKASGLEAILKAPKVDIGAIYGVGLIGNMSGRIKFWVDSIRSAQRSSPESFRGGVVLPIISGLNEQELRALRWDLGLAENSVAKPKKAKGSVKLLSVTDPMLPETVRSLKAGDVLLVHTGRVTQNLFELLFKKSRLPLLVAGKNAMNLAQLLGRPYLNTVGDYSLPGSDDLSKKAKKTISETAEAFHYSLTTPMHNRRAAKFILAALDPESDLSNYFRSLGPNGRDKVSEALRFLKGQGAPRVFRCENVFGK